MLRRGLLIAPLVLIAIGVLAWSQRRAAPFFVSGYLEADEIRVGSRVGGRVQLVHVEEGQRVAQGDKLVTLDPFDLQEQLAEAQAVLAARKAVLDKLRAGFRQEAIAQARAKRDRAAALLARLEAGPRPLELQILEDRLEVARANLVRAQSEYERVKKLYDEAQATRDEMDEATRQIDAARASFAAARDELALAREGTRAEEIAEAGASLSQAEAALAELKAGYRAEEIAEAEANVQAAQAARDAIRRRLDELTILAPLDGSVEAVDLQPGDLVAVNAPVLTLVDASRLWVRAYVPENRINLRIGQRVQLRVDALPDRRFAGRILFIARQAEFTPANVQTPEERSKQVFRIKVLVDEGREVLRPGMSADVFLESAP